MLKHPRFRYRHLCSLHLKEEEVTRWRLHLSKWMTLQTEHMWELQAFNHPDIAEHLPLLELATEGFKLTHFIMSDKYEMFEQHYLDCKRFEDKVERLANTYLPMDWRYMRTPSFKVMAQKMMYLTSLKILS